MKLLLFAFVFFFYYQVINAQNLVENGDFEKHGVLDGVPDLRNDFRLLMPSWKSGDGGKLGPTICDCNISERSEYFKQVCKMDFKAHSGCSMLELGFGPNCAIVAGQGLPFNGCATYVYTKLKKTLDIGKVYEVSMWVNFMSVFSLPDPNAHKYVGMMLSNGVLHNDGYNAMIKNTTFLADKYSHSKKRCYNGVKSAPPASRNLHLSPLRLDSAHCWDKFSAHSNHRFFSLEYLHCLWANGKS